MSNTDNLILLGFAVAIAIGLYMSAKALARRAKLRRDKAEVSRGFAYAIAELRKTGNAAQTREMLEAYSYGSSDPFDVGIVTALGITAIARGEGLPIATDCKNDNT